MGWDKEQEHEGVQGPLEGEGASHHGSRHGGIATARIVYLPERGQAVTVRWCESLGAAASWARCWPLPPPPIAPCT